RRRSTQPATGGVADEREFLKRHLHRAGARALPDHDVELVILERRIEDFLDRRRHAMNFVDEETFVLRQVGENGGEVAWFFQDRSRGRANRRAEFVAD